MIITVALNPKVTDVKNKIPGIYNLATKVDVDLLKINTPLNIKPSEIANKIPGTRSFITASEFNELTKRTKKARKNLSTKTEVNDAWDWGDKNRNKNKHFEHFVQVISLVEVIVKIKGQNVI